MRLIKIERGRSQNIVILNSESYFCKLKYFIPLTLQNIFIGGRKIFGGTQSLSKKNSD